MRLVVLVGAVIMLYAPSALAKPDGMASQPEALETFACLLAPLLVVTFTFGFLAVLLRALCSGGGR